MYPVLCFYGREDLRLRLFEKWVIGEQLDLTRREGQGTGEKYIMRNL
jgi:hypothetical protein